MGIEFNSTWWNWDTGVCGKHMIPHLPCPMCLETFDQDVLADLGKTGKKIWSYGIPDEYLEYLMQDIVDFKFHQLLFRKYSLED